MYHKIAKLTNLFYPHNSTNSCFDSYRVNDILKKKKNDKVKKIK